MAKQVRLTHCGLPVVGSTKTEARQDAERQLTALVSRVERGPKVIMVYDFAALVFPDLYSWSYCILNPKGVIRTGRTYGTSGYPTEAEASSAARRHLAQIAWNFDVADDAAWITGIEGLSHEDREELARQCRWQRAYRRARDRGMSDSEAHQYAFSHR